MFRTVKLILQPILDALFKPGIRWEYRWRLLLLQPISILTYLVTAPAWIFSRSYDVSWIPTQEGRSVRALIFQPRKRQPNKLHPLHLDIHGGGFLGGLPEYEAKFNSLLCERTGAVVVSTQYRYAPSHSFPAAIDDIDDVVQYLIQNAERLWSADPNLMTVSGFSAGGNLALAACQQSPCHAPASTAIKASVTFYAPIDLRMPPAGKPKPPKFPKKDPLKILMPLFDAYAQPVRAKNIANPRLSPILSNVTKLPNDMLLVIAGIDILAHEQLTFVERLKKDLEERGEQGRRIEAKVYDEGFHGWLELPFKLFEADKKEVFGMAVNFLEDTYKKHGRELDQ
ncbi:hypothetical protein FKW77_008620 [Venturia effusa]|uniref:Alpha/beta hydrolase fold-3 domain-containing protein n=1 Tax=Venturia effusa TaxID=50376 RepID=A0A517L7V9_9PEZI|nr:hypothetical protein FKW77_008620 [Venturia effusa]